MIHKNQNFFFFWLFIFNNLAPAHTPPALGPLAGTNPYTDTYGVLRTYHTN